MAGQLIHPQEILEPSLYRPPVRRESLDQVTNPVKSAAKTVRVAFVLFWKSGEELYNAQQRWKHAVQQWPRQEIHVSREVRALSSTPIAHRNAAAYAQSPQRHGN